MGLQEKIIHYKTVMLVLGELLEANRITEDDYRQINEIIAKKYGLHSCSIFRINP